MKGFFAGAAFKLLIAVALAAIIVNDLGSIISSQYLLSERAEQIAKASFNTYKATNSKRKAYDSAISTSNEVGATLVKFEVERNSLGIGIHVPAQRTWVAHRISSLKPYLTAKAEFTATD